MDYKLPQLPEREENSNKGTFGKILNVSGSEYMTGAAYLSSIAALKIGAGYVELASHEDCLRAVSSLAPEVVLSPINRISEIIKTSTVLLIGCGLSITNEAVETFKNTIALAEQLPAVIDADGLNILAGHLDILPKNQVVLTPHLKEFSRLTKISVEKLKKNKIEIAKEFAKKYQVILLLKGHTTIITDGDITYLVKRGCPGMATAGSGDVLSGILVGMHGYNNASVLSTATCAYLAGVAGEFAQEKYTDIAMKASDTIEFIPSAIKYIRNGGNL